MSTPILTTKLFIPPPRPNLVQRPRLLERLNEGMHCKLTLVSAPAGFGKTTLVSGWIHDLRMTNDENRVDADPPVRDGQSSIVNPVAWLSLEEEDAEPTRFLTYLIAALQTITPTLGDRVMAALQSPQPPDVDATLTALLNEVASTADPFMLVLDDYHVIQARAVDDALTFLLDHLPRQMHLVITTREDPPLPLSRLRARGQMAEVRAADLRFTPAEAAEFLHGATGLTLSADEVAALEARTEGWIAGLQLAALSMQGRDDVHGFIQAFAGDNRYVVDYLVDEVLARQPEPTRTFLLQTSSTAHRAALARQRCSWLLTSEPR